MKDFNNLEKGDLIVVSTFSNLFVAKVLNRTKSNSLRIQVYYYSVMGHIDEEFLKKAFKASSTKKYIYYSSLSFFYLFNIKDGEYEEE